MAGLYSGLIASLPQFHKRSRKLHALVTSPLTLGNFTSRLGALDGLPTKRKQARLIFTTHSQPHTRMHVLREGFGLTPCGILTCFSDKTYTLIDFNSLNHYSSRRTSPMRQQQEQSTRISSPRQ